MSASTKDMTRIYSALTRASLRRPRTSLSLRPLLYRVPGASISPSWKFYTTHTNNMSDLFVDLTAPNGRKYKQPRGLFINNEFVKSKSGETITTINPRYAYPPCNTLSSLCTLS